MGPYELTSDLVPIKKTNPIEPLLNGLYLGDQDDIKARIAGVVAQTAAKGPLYKGEGGV